ncbi:MAG: flavodoxin family protein [Planctomycetota bacterium]
MKILGISGSSRGDQKSGSHKLAETVLEASGCEYELVSLRGRKILGCTGCLGCVEDNVCVLKDDMAPLREKFVEADAFVIAAPNYFSGMNAATHALLERLYQFRHREADTLWGKLAVAVGVGGGDGLPVADQIEGFMAYRIRRDLQGRCDPHVLRPGHQDHRGDHSRRRKTARGHAGSRRCGERAWQTLKRRTRPSNRRCQDAAADDGKIQKEYLTRRQ